MARGNSMRAALAGHVAVSARRVHSDALARGPGCTQADWAALVPILRDFWSTYESPEEAARLITDMERLATQHLEQGTHPWGLDWMAENLSQVLGYEHGSYHEFDTFTCSICQQERKGSWSTGRPALVGYCPRGVCCQECLPPVGGGFRAGYHDPVRWSLWALRLHATGQGPPPLDAIAAGVVRRRILGDEA